MHHALTLILLISIFNVGCSPVESETTTTSTTSSSEEDSEESTDSDEGTFTELMYRGEFDTDLSFCTNTIDSGFGFISDVTYYGDLAEGSVISLTASSSFILTDENANILLELPFVSMSQTDDPDLGSYRSFYTDYFIDPGAIFTGYIETCIGRYLAYDDGHFDGFIISCELDGYPLPATYPGLGIDNGCALSLGTCNEKHEDCQR